MFTRNVLHIRRIYDFCASFSSFTAHLVATLESALRAEKKTFALAQKTLVVAMRTFEQFKHFFIINFHALFSFFWC
jgi:hypothetical protein